jgi:hypothetical protein
MRFGRTARWSGCIYGQYIVGRVRAAGIVNELSSQPLLELVYSPEPDTAMPNKLRKGDTVSWNTPQGKTTGKVKKRLTEPAEIEGHHVAASRDNPEYLVESDKTGKQAAHKPDALKKAR